MFSTLPVAESLLSDDRKLSEVLATYSSGILSRKRKSLKVESKVFVETEMTFSVEVIFSSKTRESSAISEDSIGVSSSTSRGSRVESLKIVVSSYSINGLIGSTMITSSSSSLLDPQEFGWVPKTLSENT